MCQKKIMRKRSHESFDDEPPRKKISLEEYVAPRKVSAGEIFTDLVGNKWKIGKVIGHGGFGDIYLASNNLQGPVKNDAPYVVKIESHSNGPLFVEINCFIRIAKSQMIESWTKRNRINHIGMPHYIASGSHNIGDDKLRFLVLPRYKQDLEKILNKHSNKFNFKTVINTGTQIIDILEYIHSNGFVHCDIKASNILYSSKIDNDKSINVNNKGHSLIETTPTNTREHYSRQCNKRRRIFTSRTKQLRSKKFINYNEEDNDGDLLEQYFENEFDNVLQEEEGMKGKIYLMDYGLATKYIYSNGQHRQYCNDERKAHAGTLMFCSLDAHLGAQSRRSDLECLGYNMIYWLTAKLPWEDLMDNPEAVEREKKKNFQDLDKFFKYCFGNEYPTFIYEYFYHIRKLTFEEKPNYGIFKDILKKALVEYGYKDDDNLDFENLEGWGKKQKLKKKCEKIVSHKNSPFIARQPLLSNSPIKKPVLRGKKNKKTKKMNWSKILSSDPEKLFKNRLLKEEIKPRDRRITDPCETPLQNMELFKMNPTYAMMDVYNKCRDRRDGNYNTIQYKVGRGDSYVPETRTGYTPAMNLILAKIKERELNEQLFNQQINSNMTSRKTRAIKSHYQKKTESVRKVQSALTINKVQSQVSGVRKEKENNRAKTIRVLRHGLRG